MQSYDYSKRVGVEAVTWERFGLLAERLAEALAAYGVEAVVGIARAGLFPATAVACALRCEVYPVRLTRRVNDVPVHASPVWRTLPPPDVAGRVIAVVDEIADTGETLRLAAEQVRALGAARVVTACLVQHTWAAPPPDVAALVSDALVLFPWDQRVLAEGRWGLHPELEAALQGNAAAAAEGINPASDP